jgi:AraC-like DNA-binding protein
MLVTGHYERFSTRGLTMSNRVEQWEQHNARALVGLECRTLSGLPLEATELNLELSALQFAHVSASAHVVERSVRHIAATPTDGVVMYFTLVGESFFYYKDGVHIQRPGDLIVSDVNEPFMRGFAQGLQEFALRVPKELFMSLSDDPLPSHPLTMRFAGSQGANVHAAALADLVRHSFADATETDHDSTEAKALDLLRAIFSANEAHSSAAYRRAAIAYVEHNLRHAQLSAPEVARAIGISERHLSRIFAETESSLSRIILEARLTRAHTILSAPAAALPIGEIGAFCGFASHAHFARVFKDRFGATPSEIRSQRSLSPAVPPV